MCLPGRRPGLLRAGCGTHACLILRPRALWLVGPSVPLTTKPQQTKTPQADSPTARPPDPALAEDPFLPTSPVPDRLKLSREGPYFQLTLLVNRMIGAIFAEEALASVVPDHLDRAVARYQVRFFG